MKKLLILLLTVPPIILACSKYKSTNNTNLESKKNFYGEKGIDGKDESQGDDKNGGNGSFGFLFGGDGGKGGSGK